MLKGCQDIISPTPFFSWRCIFQNLPMFKSKTEKQWEHLKIQTNIWYKLADEMRLTKTAMQGKRVINRGSMHEKTKNVTHQNCLKIEVTTATVEKSRSQHQPVVVNIKQFGIRSDYVSWCQISIHQQCQASLSTSQCVGQVSAVKSKFSQELLGFQ